MMLLCMQYDFDASKKSFNLVGYYYVLVCLILLGSRTEVDCSLTPVNMTTVVFLPIGYLRFAYLFDQISVHNYATSLVYKMLIAYNSLSLM